MKRDVKLIAEAYKKVSGVKPKLMVPDPDGKWMKWLEELDYEVHEDGSISVNGDVNLEKLLQDRLPFNRLPFNFNKITGSLYIDGNLYLTSLVGCPTYVGGNFDCAQCYKLENLLYAPTYVGGYFDCRHCPLKSLEGASDYVGTSFHCSFTEIISFEGAPEYVGVGFAAYDCPNLKSLKGLTPGCKGYQIDGFTQDQIDQYFEKLDLKGTATGDPTFDDFFGIGED